MPIYKQTTEIMNIDDLLSSVERDIEEVYFGDKNVFTVWAEYDGTLPAQYSANGDYLADYRIYGSAGGVGDRTANCLEIRDGSFTKTSGATNLTVTAINGVITFDGTVFELPSGMAEWKSNFDFYLDAGTYYITESLPLTSGFGRYIKKYNDNSNVVSSGTTVFTLSERTRVYLSFYIYDKTFDNAQVKITLVEGSTAPASYVPHGYGVDMSVSDGNTSTTTSIYIGSDPLEADEYVDYATGKIYRVINIFDKNSQDIQLGKAIDRNGDLVDDPTAAVSGLIDISGYSDLYIKGVSSGSNRVMYILYFGESLYVWRVIGDESVHIQTYDADHMRITVLQSCLDTAVVSPYSTPQPQDPPVPLPALPTVDGTNIVDYAGQSTPPSRFYAKYRKEGF